LPVRLERANSLIALDRNAEAREDVDFVLKAEPLSVVGNYLETVLQVRAGDFMLADLALSRIYRHLDQFPLGWYYFSVVKYNIGQAEQAAVTARYFLAANPDDPQAIKLYARVELAGRRPDGVVKLLARAADAGLADAEMFDLLGRAHALTRAPVRAIENFQRAAALTEDKADIMQRIQSIRFSTVDAGP
jgi:predicted Zn-dependent protease